MTPRSAGRAVSAGMAVSPPATALSVKVSVVDNASPVIRALWWHLWWWSWGTHGVKRRRALVVIP